MSQAAVSDTIESKKVPFGTHIKTRLFSFIVLSALISGCGVLARESYYIVADSFVAPAILSPQNDLVLDARLKLEQISLQKSIAEQALAESEADLIAGEKASSKLIDLRDTVSHSLTWTSQITTSQVSMGIADVKIIATQKEELNNMIIRQSLLVDDAKKNLDGGLIQRSDYDHEVQSLDALKLSLFDNDRTKMASDLQLKQASMGQQSLYAGNKGSMPMPDQVMALNSLITVEVQLLQTEALQRVKLAEKAKDQEELTKISILEKDLKERPIYKAMDKQQDLSFAPYNALRDIKSGAKVMDCIWALFKCREVGKVTDVIPGETTLPDIFGSGMVRGQFITIDLNKEDHDLSMQSKILRIRK